MQDAASRAAGAVQQAPDTIVRQTQGNPLAAGLIAFGVGWLVSSLLPATEKEQQLAQQAETAVRENKDALLGPAKQVAQEIGDELKPAAQQAVSRSRPPPGRRRDRQAEEGKSAAQDVQGQAQQSKQKVQSQASSLLLHPVCRPAAPALRPAGFSGGAQCCSTWGEGPPGLQGLPQALT